jgi:hypothetical protein
MLKMWIQSNCLAEECLRPNVVRSHALSPITIRTSFPASCFVRISGTAARAASLSEGYVSMARQTAARYEKDHRIALTSLLRDGSPCYKILNDNRYEQHSRLWKYI